MPNERGSFNAASIDIGSHTIRLLIASCEEETAEMGSPERRSPRLTPVLSERRITRLARGFQNGGNLMEENMTESVRVVEEYRALLERHEAGAVTAGATGVIRKARNGANFIRKILGETGIEARILSETEEALISARGIFSVLPEQDLPVVAFDLGGSSTEFLLARPDEAQPSWSTSVFIGAATATERYLRGDPTEPDSIAEARSAISQALHPTLTELKVLLHEPGATAGTGTGADLSGTSPGARGFQIIGSAGTATTLAAINLRMETYEPYRVNGLHLTSEWLDGIIARLAELPVASRTTALPGLEKGREDIILGGALIVREILSQLGTDRIIISDAGLLEGLLVCLVEDEFNLPHTLKSPVRLVG